MAKNSRLLVSATAALWMAALPLAGCHDFLGIDIVVGGQPDGGPDPGQDGGADAGSDAPPATLLCSGDVAQKDAWACVTRTVCEVARKCISKGITDDDCQRADIEVFDGVRLVPGNTLLQNAIVAGTLKYQSAGLVECLAHLASVPCADLSGHNPFDECKVFTGLVPDGGTCFIDLECKDIGAECVKSKCGPDTCCAGFCQAPAPVGGDCYQTSGICEPGSYCINGICSAGKGGDSCFSSNDCDEPFWCNDGRCAPDLPTGSDCLDNAACARPESCVGLDFPESWSGRCARSQVDGDPCDGECDSRFTHYCDFSDPSGGGPVCKRRSKLGELCNPEADSCELGLRCNAAGMCESLGDLGAVCNESSECRAVFGERFCSNEVNPTRAGVCSAGDAAGSPCLDSRHCASGVCTNGRCVDFSGCYP